MCFVNCKHSEIVLALSSSMRLTALAPSPWAFPTPPSGKAATAQGPQNFTWNDWVKEPSDLLGETHAVLYLEGMEI